MTGKIKDALFVHDTSIENIFINEFVPLLGEEALKVFLCGSMLEQRSARASIQSLVQHTRLSVADVTKAIDNLVAFNLAEKHGDEIHIISLREEMFLAKDEDSEHKQSQDERWIEEEERQKANFYADLERNLGNTLNDQMTRLAEEFLDLGMSPEVVSYAFSYATDLGKMNARYIRAILNDWNVQGFETEKAVRKYIDETQNWADYYKNVFAELGFHRGWGLGEAERMRRWVEELGFEKEEVVAICREKGGIPNPNLNYIEAILNNIYKERTGEAPQSAKDKAATQEIKISLQDVEAYYRAIRQSEAANLKSRTEEIRRSIPAIDHLLEEKQELVRERLQGLKGGVDMADLNERFARNEAMIRKVLEESSLPPDILEHQYRCEKCKDSGRLEDGSQCECFSQRRAELYDQKRRAK